MSRLFVSSSINEKEELMMEGIKPSRAGLSLTSGARSINPVERD